MSKSTIEQKDAFITRTDKVITITVQVGDNFITLAPTTKREATARTEVIKTFGFDCVHTVDVVESTRGMTLEQWLEHSSKVQ